MNEKRWPPTYDLEDLLTQINEISQLNGISYSFYTKSCDLDFCQGDVIFLESDFPLINEDGDVALIENSLNLWVFVGNTCDFTRPLDNVKFTHICPLTKLPDATPEELLGTLHTYSTYKKFFLPDWDSSNTSKGYYIDFSKMCSIAKDGITKNAKLKARMGRHSWLLFHSCLVRYLARDDGRND